MAKEKAKTKRLTELIALLVIAALPFGNIFSGNISLAGSRVTINFIDTLALLSIPIYLSKSQKRPRITKYFYNLIVILTFGLILSLSNYSRQNVAVGSFYLLRLVSYFTLFVLLINIAKNSKERYLNYLSIAGLITAFIGWVQYFFVPDLTFLKQFHWDDHAYRLMGGYLDPSFTGIMLLLALVLALFRYERSQSKKYGLEILFLFVSVIFTYSRATYAALIAVAIYYFWKKKKLKYLAAFLLTTVVIVSLLPRPASEGVKLERLYSITNRIDNYRRTAIIFREYPLFGVGYNNICAARREVFSNDAEVMSKSCSGAESGILLALATFGTVGFLVFLRFIKSIFDQDFIQKYKDLFYMSSIVLFVHMQFSNSIFYPWTMAWMGLILAMTINYERL